jgi:dienelactone hydrolase
MSLWILLVFAALVFGETKHHVAYRVNGASYDGYYLPAGEGAPLILLIHDWDGLTDYEVKRAHMLSESGYSVFAADLFGAGVRPTAIADKRRLTGELYQDRAKMRQLIHGALHEAEARGEDVTNAVAMGYCFGGTAVLELARAGADLKGFVTFHGGLATPEGQDYSKAQGEFLILHGTADSAVPIEEFAALAKELESAGVAHEMITYGGADHAFTVFGGERYHRVADEKSWLRFVGFLEALFQVEDTPEGPSGGSAGE